MPPFRWRPRRSARRLRELCERDWASVFSAPAAYRIQHKLHREVLYVPPPPGSGLAGSFAKVFHPTRWGTRLLQALLLSKAAREYYLSRVLARCGVPVAEPLGYLSLYRRGALGWSIFVSRAIPGARSLCEELSSISEPSRRAMLVGCYGMILGRLNRAGFYAADYYASNVLFGSGEGFAPVLIDHEATRPIVGWFRRWREKNLVAALFSEANPPLRSDGQTSFVEAYLKALWRRPPEPREAAELLARVKRRREKLERHRQRRKQRNPFKRLERWGALRLRRRRDVNGALLIEMWQQVEPELCKRERDDLAALHLKLEGQRYRAVPYAIGGRGSQLFHRLNPLTKSPAERLLAERPDALGSVERAPNGPAAAFFLSD